MFYAAKKIKQQMTSGKKGTKIIYHKKRNDRTKDKEEQKHISVIE